MNKYAVVKDEHVFNFSKLHENKEEAKKEAARLCLKERAVFHIIKIIISYSPDPGYSVIYHE